MSYVPTDPETNQNAPQGQTTNAPGQTAGMPPPQSGGSTGGGQAAGTPSGASNGSSTQFGSSASKLGDYLSANAPQIQNQANTVASGLNTQYGQIGQDIGNAANQFGQQVQGGYAAPNQNLVNQAAANPSGFVSMPGNVSAFQGQLNDQYTGPTSFEGSTPYSNIQNEVNTATQNAGLLGTQAGLQNYLAGNQGGNQTAASNTLDALLLQGNPQAQQTVNTAAKQFQVLPGQLASDVTAQDQSVTAAQQAAQQAAQYATGQFGTAGTNFNNNLQNELTAANNANSAYNTNVANERSALQSGNIANAPGIDTGLANWFNNTVTPWDTQNAAYVNVPQANYVNALGTNVNPQVPALGNVASAQDYATLAALGQLGGNAFTSPLTAATANEAGTYQAPTLGNVNNQQIAQDMLNNIENTSGNISGAPGSLQQYYDQIGALQQYLGQPILGAAQGQNWSPITSTLPPIKGIAPTANPIVRPIS